MKRAIKRVIDGLQDHKGAIDPGVIELLAELVKLAAAVIPGLIKGRSRLEQEIEDAARDLPPDWMISIGVGPGYAGVELHNMDIGPVKVPEFDCEVTLAEQVKALVELAKKKESETLP